MPTDDRLKRPAPRPAKVSPYVVFRRGRLPVAELRSLRFDGSWARIDESRSLRAACERRAAELSDVLAALVPRVDGSVRAELVALRRDVFNQRAAPALRRLGVLEQVEECPACGGRPLAAHESCPVCGREGSIASS